jgi:hypothetical protein
MTMKSVTGQKERINTVRSFQGKYEEDESSSEEEIPGE